MNKLINWSALGSCIKMIKSLNNILVKPAGPDCNMACSYCFYSDKARLFPGSNKHRMSYSILEEMIKQLMQQGPEQLTISWQGGEPALMGLPFCQQAVDLMQHYGQGQNVGNGFQTNGTLLNREWARFFRKYKFLVGLSIDGPQHVHDHYRNHPDGQGTWSKVVDTARMLMDEDIAVNVLSVVNDYSVRHPEEIYQYLRDTGFTYMQFIPCVEADIDDPGKAASFSVSPDAYGNFLCTVFDLWRADFLRGRPTTSIRFFESLLYSYEGFEPPECTLLSECGKYVVVEHNGDVYSCDFFVEPEWHLGNITQASLGAMLNSEKRGEFGRMKAVLSEKCKKCKWLKYCRGGCTKDRLRVSGGEGISHFCKSYLIFFKHVDRELSNLGQQWRQSQKEADGNEEPNPGKVGRNAPCPCGSGKKFKKCCLSSKNQ